MKLDLDFYIKNLNGTEAKEALANEMVANIIAQKTTHLSFAKGYRIAVDLTKDKYVEIDMPDLDLLIKEISDCQALPNLTKAQIVCALEEAKKKSETKTVSEEKSKKK